MHKKIQVALATSLLLSANAFADGNITGEVVNKKTAEPIDYVSVTLINAQTGTPLQLGGITDSNGRFTIAQAPAGKYIVRISNMGSVTQEREVVVGNAEINLGRIELADDIKLLEEVVVTGQKSQMSIDSERRVFNVGSNIASAGASADELLAAVPSVDVNSDGDISLRGNSDVLVWINGKEMGMNADNRAQFLRQIPAESIESIEVMTNASSKNSAEGTAGIINIRLKENSRNGYFGHAEANVDSHGSASASFNINVNEGKFASYAGINLRTQRKPGGMTSYRTYDEGDYYMNSFGKNKKRENSMFLQLGTNYTPNENNTFYISAVGTLGHKWGHTNTLHLSDIPGQWTTNFISMRESGDTRGVNALLGYKHIFGTNHFIDMNVSYNIWQGPNDNRTYEESVMPDTSEEIEWQSQHQDVKISNWEAAVDYSNMILSWLKFEAGYKGNYNHENSPAYYYLGQTEDDMTLRPELFNRFKYDTDITALYINFSGKVDDFTFSAGLRGETWQTRTRSLTYGQNDADVPELKRNDFSLFPSASIGYSFLDRNELKLNYSRRIRRPFGPQLNTFENMSDPSEVHLGNPLIEPEYSNAVELTYIKNWNRHMLSAAAYVRSHTDMISHVSFLAPMTTDPNTNTMYYGHANVGNMLNTGVEIISRNTLFDRLTLTTTLNLYNSHLKAWSTEYPLHGGLYEIYGKKQDRFAWDVRCMASVRLPWEMTFQATGKYNSRRVTAQGTLEHDWEVEAGLKKNLGAWSFSLLCKDIFDSKKSQNILYGNGYIQNISKWSGGRTFRLGVAYNFGKTKGKSNERHQHVNTGGYGEEHVH